MNLTFNKGRATVELADGNTLSIITEARWGFMKDADPMLMYAKAMGGVSQHPRASFDTYEVAVINESPDGDTCVMTTPYPELLAYIDPDLRTSHWITYAFVPIELVESLIERVGVAHAHTEDRCCMEHDHHVTPHRGCILR